MADNIEKSGETSKKVFDIAKPGKMKSVDATARPVIVGNRPMMQDPMMVANPDSDLPSAPQLRQPGKVVIRPVSYDDEVPVEEVKVDDVTVEGAKLDEVKADEKSDVPEDLVMTAPETTSDDERDKPDAVVDVEKVVEKTDASKPEEDKKEEVETKLESEAETSEKTEESEKPTGTPVAEGEDENLAHGGTPTAEEIAAAEAAAKQQEELNKFVEEKQYFLPINSVERHRSRIAELVGVILIVLLLALLVELLMDVGFVTIPGIKPFTSFF